MPADHDPESFEKRVKAIIQEKLLPSAAGEDVVVHHRRRYRGRSSGHDHEIDVSFEISLGGIAILVLVECKCYRRRVGVDDVLEFSARLQDIGAHKGILVTTVGFQDGAKKMARARGIALLTATISHYKVVARATGTGLPDYSARFFDTEGCRFARKDDAFSLVFQPVDENCQVELHYLVSAEELPPQDVDGFIALEIVESGTDGDVPAGTIPLDSAKR